MRYEFRTSDGKTCCSTDNPDYLCRACKQRLARMASDLPRDANGVPDPYRIPPVTPTRLGPTYQPYGTPPDPYAIALQKQKERR
jgi:hypothetical protein